MSNVNISQNVNIRFWEGNSRPPVSSWNLPFWDDPWLNIRCLWIFQVGHTFYKLEVKMLATSNKMRCVRCSWPSTLSWAVDIAKEALGTSLRMKRIFKFWTMKSAVELSRLLLKFILLVRWDIQKSSLKDNAKLNFLEHDRAC